MANLLRCFRKDLHSRAGAGDVDQACPEPMQRPRLTPTINSAEISDIETALACELPKNYRKFLLNHAQEVKQLEELMPLRVLFWTDPTETSASG